MLVTDASADLIAIVSRAVAGGVSIVQFRSDIESWPDWLSAARAAHAATWPQARFVTNCRREWMGSISYDGTQLKESDDRSRSAILFYMQPEFDFHVPREFMIGQSVHSVKRAIECDERGVDYLVAGTIFDSNSHPGLRGKGPGFLADVCAAVSIPVIAIGGITPDTVGECIAAGAAGVAVQSPIMRAKAPEAVASRYRTALDQAWSCRQPATS